MRIVSASDTYKQFRKEKISDDDLKDAVSRAERGLIDAQLGAFLIKQRIPRKGQGRSKGFRSIICYKNGDRAIFLHMFPKNKKDNLTPVELEEYEKIARNLSDLSDETITQLVQSRGWKEIK